MDLLSLVLTLSPLEQPSLQKPLPQWWGRAAHALVLNVARQYDPPLAASIHDWPEGKSPDMANSQPVLENAVRPFTVSTLMGRFPAGNLDTERPYMLRLTAFQKEMAKILWDAAQNGPLSAGSEVELDYLKFRVDGVLPGEATDGQNSQAPSPWAQAATYQDLSAVLLLAKQPAPRRVSLQFTSPTTFKSGGMHVPVPMPDLVFGSLLDRWNAYAPIAFPAETKRYAAECMALGYYKLSSRAVPMKRGGLRIGAVGEATYTCLNYDRYWMSVIGTLAAFALFSGVGAGTTMGLGQCRMD